MKQGLSQWSTTLAKGMGVSALAIAMAGCVATPGTSSSSEQQQTQSSAPVITSSANNVSSAPVVTSSSMATASSAPSLADEDVAIVANYDGNIPLLAAKGKPGAPLQTDGNPFQDSYFYLSPDIKTMMDYSLNIVGDSGPMADKIKYVQHQPSAIWMDSTATIAGNPEAGRRSLIQHLDAAVAQQNYYAEQDGQMSPMTVVVIVYNLPDRDCAAFASNGKLYEVGKPQDPMPNNGMQRYRDEYLGKILDAFQAKPEFANLRLVAMLEPDSYPNMTTNTILNPDGPALKWPALTAPDGETYCDTLLSKYSSPGLEDGLGVYGHGLQIAIEELAKIDNTYTYLDIAHAGWLGWDGNLDRGVEGFLKLIRGANTDGISGFSKVRGFASNTSGYTPLVEHAISNADGDKMNLADFYEWNSAVDEMTYIDRFSAAVKAAQPGFNPGFIIDTARNGWGRPGRPTSSATRGTDISQRIDRRVHRGHWCNVADAGVGETSKASPDSSRPHLDAFFWMKPPGEADGISFDVKDFAVGTAAYNALDAVDKAIVQEASDPAYIGKSLDTMCIPGQERDGGVLTKPMPFMSPHAGAWFHKQFIELIDNAHPPLGTTEY